MMTKSPTWNISESFRPKLALHGTFCVVEGNAYRIDTGEHLITLETTILDIRAFLERCDGGLTIIDMANALGVEKDVVSKVVTMLFRYGALTDAGAGASPASLFQEHICRLGRSRLARVSGHIKPLIAPDIKFAKRLLLGSLVENFHIVNAAASHISGAVASASSPHLRFVLCQYLTDEYRHSETLRLGLLAAGITETELCKARPLPATQALIDHLRWIARSDILAYAACLAVVEGACDEPNALVLTQDRWKEIEDLGLLPLEALMPFREHELEDLRSGHGSFSAVVFGDYGELSPSQQESITDAIHRLVLCHQMLYLQQKQFYGVYEGSATFSHESESWLVN